MIARRVAFNLGNRPNRMLGNHRVRILATRVQVRQGRWIARVSEGHTDIAKEAAMRNPDHAIRTNIVLDTDLVDAGFKLTGIKTRRDLVDFALRELVRHEQQKQLLKLKGRIDWQGDLDALRTDVPLDPTGIDPA